MKYQVDITETAARHISAAFEYIHDRSPMNAEKWLRNLYKAIASLELFPTRCGRARESAYLDEDLRQYIYKSHRVVFRVNEQTRTVHVLYVLHGRQRAIGEPRDPDE